MNYNFNDIEISPDFAVINALKVIDKNFAKIALVVDSERRLLGTLTDGDIRRGLLQGKTLDTTAEDLMNRSFRFVRTGHDEAEALEMMRREAIFQIPVLDLDGKVVDLILLKEVLSPAIITNPVVIMAGGKGTRLRPYTETCPKPMLPVNGKPILEILLEQFISSGFKNFYFSVNYLKEKIIDYFKDGSSYGVSINYLVEDEPLGTAGSLQLLPADISQPFLVMNGDVLTHFNPSQLLRFHQEHEAHSTICVREYTTTIPFGVVKTDGFELAGFEEKPSYRQLVNAGVYIIDPSLIQLLPKKQSTDMPSLLNNAQNCGYRVAVCPIHEYWLDVGRPETLQQAHQDWFERK